MVIKRKMELFVKASLARFPTLYAVARRFAPKHRETIPFSNSNDYWQERYATGYDSGDGSYGTLARYKADFINAFCKSNNLASVLEFGCGDGNQQSLFDVTSYTGLDISPTAVATCQKNYPAPNRSFMSVEQFNADHKTSLYDLVLSLDVIYHLVEDQVYFEYLDGIFSHARKTVLIYSSDLVSYEPKLPHVKHRKFTEDVLKKYPTFKLKEVADNPHAKGLNDAGYGSFAKFHVFTRQG